MTPLSDILYAFALPSWEPHRVTPFQGFAPGLISLSTMLSSIVQLPTDIHELTMDPPDRLVRRRAGQGAWLWSPVNVETLVRHRKPTALQPFMVVFTADRNVARQVTTWRRGLRIRPLHVSLIEGGGAIHPDELTVSRLQQFCKTALRQASESNRRLDIRESLAAIDDWRPMEERDTSLHFHSHNVTLANQLVLMSAGERRATGEEGHLNASPEQDYIDGITQSAHAVRALHEQTEDRPVYLLNPPRPDVILLAPAMYRGADRMVARAGVPAAAARAFRALGRQRGYTTQVPMREDEIDDIGTIMSVRGAELKVQSFAAGLRAASTLAATIRLPARVNRTAGVVGHLARHLRNFDENVPNVKTARVFKVVQDALRDSIPDDHLALLRQSTSGVKIIADAPLEWMPVDGLPLGIRMDVSRINTTPGNLLIEQLRHIPPLYIPAEEFKSYLVVSMFESDDSLAHHVASALRVLPGASEANITGTRATPRTVDEFVDAVNAYDGPILIVDSHGTHPDNPDVGGLIIGGRPVDIWTLRDRIKLPPIVILSACDTHPFDRSHATVANGFLNCGALAVLGTVLPIRSRSAAIFLVRLMLRAITFGAAMNGMGMSVPWTNIVGGALRMQLASDVVKGLVERGLLPEERSDEVQLSANMDINHPRPDWVERLAAKAQEIGGFDQVRWQAVFDDILAGSDVIRYVNIGNPESILISDHRVVQRAMAESGADQTEIAS